MYLGSSQTFSERADDLLFETRIKNRLLFESGIYSNNYSVDVVNGNVYVMGTASNFDEKTKLENFLREMKDIKKLITIVSLPKKIQNDKNLKNEKKIKNKKNPRISVLFQMDSFENLDFDTDTTLNLIQEALKINADVWVGYPKNLTYSDGEASITAKKIVSSDLSFGKPKNLKINEFDFYFIRQDPPFNMSYLTNCYLLELHKSFNKKPFFVNDPSGIKNFTEKIFPLFFSELMPKSLVTEDEMIFLKMLRKHKYLVIKTLYNKGGEGVVKVSDENEKKAIKEFNNIKKRYSVPVVVQ